MRKEHWIDQMSGIARDFEDAHVKAFLFKRIGGHVTCLVTVVNADGKEVTWELVDGGVSSDRWRKVPNQSTSWTLGGFHLPPGEQGSCPDRVVLNAIKSVFKKDVSP